MIAGDILATSALVLTAAGLILMVAFFLIGPEGGDFVVAKVDALTASFRHFFGRRRTAHRLLRKTTRQVAQEKLEDMASRERAATLHAQGALSFTQKDIERLAAMDFASEPWRNMLRGRYPDRRAMHIRQAATLVSELAASTLPNSAEYRVFEIGPGSGHGAVELIRHLKEENPALDRVYYRAVDVCRYWCRETNRAIRRELSDPALKVDPFVRRSPVLRYMDSLEPGGLDVVLAGYSLHHNVSLDVILSSLRYIPGILRLMNARDRKRFQRVVRRALLSLTKRDDGANPELVWAIEGILKLGWESNSPQGLPEFLNQHEDLLRGSLRDPRGEIIKRCAEALNPSGVMLVADPDGQSWFNRREITKPGHELIAAANLCDRERAVLSMSRAGLKIVSVYVQCQVRAGDALELRDPIRLEQSLWRTPVEELPERVLPPAVDRANIDLHLGYVICASKPG